MRNWLNILNSWSSSSAGKLVVAVSQNGSIQEMYQLFTEATSWLGSACISKSDLESCGVVVVDQICLDPTEIFSQSCSQSLDPDYPRIYSNEILQQCAQTIVPSKEVTDCLIHLFNCCDLDSRNLVAITVFALVGVFVIAGAHTLMTRPSRPSAENVIAAPEVEEKASLSRWGSSLWSWCGRLRSQPNPNSRQHYQLISMNPSSL